MKAEEVGYRIAQARKKQGMTQRELSERLHVSDKAVSKWERGVNYPDISLFDEIAKTLDLSLVELLGIEDRSKEEIVQNISEISKYEKEKIEESNISAWICYNYMRNDRASWSVECGTDLCTKMKCREQAYCVLLG